MSSIYQNSYITIAATKSTDDEGGCFSQASPLNLDYKPSTAGQLYVREKLVHWNTLGHSDLLRAYPLLTRGWVYQERLLSPRVLHFTQKELVWECLQGSSCECSSFCPATQPKVEHSAAIQSLRKSPVVELKEHSEKESESGKAELGIISRLRSWRPLFKEDQYTDYGATGSSRGSQTNGKNRTPNLSEVNTTLTVRQIWVSN
jgi:hypothetical protein